MAGATRHVWAVQVRRPGPRRGRQRRPARVGHRVLRGLGAPLTLLVSPYGLDMAAYYRTMFVGSTVRGHVTEWQPITSSPATAVVFFVLAGVAVWSFGRQPSRTTLWERLALLVLASGSIWIVR